MKRSVPILGHSDAPLQRALEHCCSDREPSRLAAQHMPKTVEKDSVVRILFLAAASREGSRSVRSALGQKKSLPTIKLATFYRCAHAPQRA